MKKIKCAANFDCKFVTIDDGSVYLKFDFGGFYEWYKHMGNTFLLLDVATSKGLEKSVEFYESLKNLNVINLDNK